MERNKAKKSRMFTNRKALILKKAKELGILCDVPVCAVIIEPNGDVHTWPENKNEVQAILTRYRNRSNKNKKPSTDDQPKNTPKTRDFLATLSEDWVNDLSKDSLPGLVTAIDTKIEEIQQRIRFLKQNQNRDGVDNPEMEIDCNPKLETLVSKEGFAVSNQLGTGDSPSDSDETEINRQDSFPGLMTAIDAKIEEIQQRIRFLKENRNRDGVDNPEMEIDCNLQLETPVSKEGFAATNQLGTGDSPSDSDATEINRQDSPFDLNKPFVYHVPPLRSYDPVTNICTSAESQSDIASTSGTKED
ncbi:putative ovule protein [Forsythia ovata]|uniref:Ovule protein n=1 Tax=Forsythia ovata TaxID=205694 RepID=A0ABD1TU00_9LAMI